MSEPSSSPERVPVDPSLRDVDEAMRQAAATARRRAARTSVAASASERSRHLLTRIDEAHPSFDAMLGSAMRQSEDTLYFVVNRINGLKMPDLPNSKRMQLASGCLHLTIEHGQSIVVLTQEKCFGSALALQRPLLETFERGLWLWHAATDDQVDAAGRDEFPLKNGILNGLNKALERDGTSYMGGGFWKRLCSYTHGGYQQIGARLTKEGLQSNYTFDEVKQVLRSSEMVQLAAAAGLATMAANESLAKTFLERLKLYERREKANLRRTEIDA